MLRFIHISDTHIHSDPEFSNYGHKPRTNLIHLLSLIESLPFEFDFVLHTGDVVEDRKEASYLLAKEIFSKYSKPIYFASGNHDDSVLLQSAFLGISEPRERYDYTFSKNGVQVCVLDTGGVKTGRMGQLEANQLDWFESICLQNESPLVIAMHHPAVPLGSHWLDMPDARGKTMLLADSSRFLDIVRKVRHRLKGVFLGHVHRAFQVLHEGVLYSSAPSTFGQLKGWPNATKAQAAPEEAPGYCLVTIDEGRTLIQQYTFPSHDF